MNTFPRFWSSRAGFGCLLAVLSFLIAPAAAYAQKAQKEYPKKELETEQNIMAAHISDANFHISRGISAVSANLPDSTKVSLLRATARVAQVDEMMKGHPERIERVAGVIFTPREEVRKPLRAKFSKLREDFGAVEDSMIALRRDMMRKGFMGDQLKGQIAVLDAVKNLLPQLDASDPDFAAQVRALIEQINQALAAGDADTAAKLIKQLEELLRSKGHGGAIKKAEENFGNSSKDNPGNNPKKQDLPGGGLAEEGGGGVTVTDGGGNSTTVKGSTLLPDNKIRLPNGEEYSLKGSRVDENGNIHLAKPPGGKITPEGDYIPDRSGQGDGKTLKEMIPEGYSYDPVTGEIKGVDKRYAGDKGGRLVSEQQVTIKVDSGQGDQPVIGSKQLGASRSWVFGITEVAGSRKKSGGTVTMTFAFSDRNGQTGFEANWEVTGSAGSPSLSNTSGTQVTVTFSASGTYNFAVSGKTDWGSPFRIPSSLSVDVDAN